MAVGKLKDPSLEFLEHTYSRRITHPPLHIHEVRAYAEHSEKEAQNLLSKIEEICQGSARKIILLEEKGKSFNSQEFSRFWQKVLGEGTHKIFFLIGGAQGFHPKVQEVAAGRISLSPLTFPHKLARILFVEQVYRAQTILQGHPYHNP